MAELRPRKKLSEETHYSPKLTPRLSHENSKFNTYGGPRHQGQQQMIRNSGNFHNSTARKLSQPTPSFYATGTLPRARNSFGRLDDEKPSRSPLPWSYKQATNPSQTSSNDKVASSSSNNQSWRVSNSQGSHYSTPSMPRIPRANSTSDLKRTSSVGLLVSNYESLDSAPSPAPGEKTYVKSRPAAQLQRPPKPPVTAKPVLRHTVRGSSNRFCLPLKRLNPRVPGRVGWGETGERLSPSLLWRVLIF